MKIERQLQGTLNTIFTELIREKGLEGRILPYPAQEENRADITLKNKNGKPLFFIELKDPTAKDGKRGERLCCGTSGNFAVVTL